MILLRSVFRFADSPIRIVNARSEIFSAVVGVLKDKISEQATKAAVKFLIEVCPWGRNRIKAVEGGAVGALIEILMEEVGNGRRTEEMAVRAVEVMCGCAEGRAELVGHAAGMAVVAKKILRVSHAATERAVRILSAVSKYSATGKVVAEMLEVGVVAKLCLVVQVDAGWKSKEKAREILRRHSRAWRNSPCIPSHLISSFPV
ncbi:E3 ubiquitin-protein ligase PUB23 [Linum grandiflorum]